jgi:probable F420-dependent oxidoreductase
MEKTPMHYGIDLVSFGEYADPRNAVPLARAAEAAGWDGFFVWDHLAFAWGVPSGDPWVILAAVAQATERLKLGPMVTPAPRHRPQLLANTIATLDRLSEGRVILGAGLGGVPREFEAFGETGDAKTRAAMLDEGLALLDQLFAGEPVSHRGEYFTLDDVTLAPLPVQRPRVPIWIGGESRPALRRAARWDGWVGAGDDQEGRMVVTPEEIAGKAAYIREHRSDPGPFEIALSGVSEPSGSGYVGEYAAAGVTWWLESIHGFRGDRDTLLARINAGPPI